jgi:hypothetical protein
MASGSFITRAACGHLLGKAANAAQGDHPIAQREAGHAVAHGQNAPGDLAAWRERPRRLHLVFAAHHQPVREIYPRGLDADQQLAGFGDGGGNLLHGQVFDGAKFMANDGFQARSPW